MTKTWDFVDANDKPIAEAGEEMQFTIRVKNTGNIDIGNLVYVDTFEDGNGTSLEEPVLSYSSAEYFK